MLITFRSKTGDITMFGEVGKKMLALMGQSGVVPGALMAADLPAAIARLRESVNRESAVGEPVPPPRPKGAREDHEPPIALTTRAKPLIDMLERAAKAGADVIWE
ncbi:MAG: DUF1840 domain-containing protein [Betaproteobacteria bacterium]|nr:DUF1840 domain-containing protein [Betaproteobacteria bacterium]